jgi:hypothetical protein
LVSDRDVFTRPFAAALIEACSRRAVTQKQIGEQIALREYQHHRPGGVLGSMGSSIAVDRRTMSS